MWWRTRHAGSIDALPRLIGQLTARETLAVSLPLLRVGGELTGAR